jgi:hypothetical protein
MRLKCVIDSKPTLENDLAHAGIWIQQQLLCFLDPHPGEIVGEIRPGDFLKVLQK